MHAHLEIEGAETKISSAVATCSAATADSDGRVLPLICWGPRSSEAIHSREQVERRRGAAV